ncbi:DUF5996 family protein [Acidobacterium sp. S8]|uniref:DUF5996 family protein n=1 Tax=Acidobacterium sp. S8 TaxID=1641854 RepID=UPI00131B18DE|nr:DUF5996 family protein [Acidobacterium sp. S8]
MPVSEHGINIAPTRSWPALPESAWSDTRTTLQLWMQIVGKIRLALMPAINHTWSVTLYPSVRGFTTSIMPYGTRTLQIDFDFRNHLLQLETSEGLSKTIPLQSMTVAVFYGKVMAALDDLATPVRIWPVPVEMAQHIPFDQDHTHQAYDPEYAQRFWNILLQTTRVITIFRARFVGKVSPIHLFWGALDLACTRFSGRTAPEHPGVAGLADRVTRDAYSHEVSSCGFWPGATGIEPLFYSYAYPEPPGYRESSIALGQASFDPKMGEFVLPYEAMRLSADPDSTLLQFLQSTYEAAANCAHWDRGALEVAKIIT